MLRVVIVEDELPLLRELTETFSWRSVNCTVAATATTAAEARQVIARVRPDILVTDIKLPDGDGITLVEETTPRAAIIITGHGQIDFAQRALRAGAADFLLKPLDDEELRRSLQRASIRALSGGFGGSEPPPGQKESAPPPSPIPSPETPPMHPLVHEALLYIQKHYHRDIGLAEAARHLAITESHLATLFRQERSQTFMQALTAHRITVAQTLLRDPRNQITQVAWRCGYRDPAYFAKVFRRIVGSSPREYRLGE